MALALARRRGEQHQAADGLAVGRTEVQAGLRQRHHADHGHVLGKDAVGDGQASA